MELFCPLNDLVFCLVGDLAYGIETMKVNGVETHTYSAHTCTL